MNFKVYGAIHRIWVDRVNGSAFVKFDDKRDEQDAILGLNGKNGWCVELAHGGRGRGWDYRGGRCYECGECGHFARECRLRIGRGGSGSGWRRIPSPRYRRRPSNGRSDCRQSGRRRRRRNQSWS